MRELHLVGVQENGEHIVLVDADEQGYQVLIDDALRAAVRRDRLTRQQLSGQGRQPIRPREIQHRIRAGHDAADIAAATGIAVEHIRKYEGPILAERQNVVLRARQTALRRRDGLSPTLAQTCDERLVSRGVNLEDDTEWDAWRAEDGSWLIQLRLVAGDAQLAATWRYDPASVHLTPLDGEAKRLSDEQPQAPQPTRTDTARHRLERVLRRPEDRASDTVEIGDRAAIAAAGRSRFPADIVDEPQPESPEPGNLEPGNLEPDSPEVDTDREPPPAHPADSHPEDLPDATVVATGLERERALIEESADVADPALESLPTLAEDDEEHLDEPDQLDGQEHAEGQEHIEGQEQIDLGLGAAPPPSSGARRNRPSVPSWDDILFGSKKS